MSRPTSSVPHQCASEGACNAGATCASGSYGTIEGAARADQDQGRKHRRRLPCPPASAGKRASAPSVHAALPRCARPGMRSCHCRHGPPRLASGKVASERMAAASRRATVPAPARRITPGRGCTVSKTGSHAAGRPSWAARRATRCGRASPARCRIGRRHGRKQRARVGMPGAHGKCPPALPVSTIAPRYMTATRSQRCRTTNRSWLMNR